MKKTLKLLLLASPLLLAACSSLMPKITPPPKQISDLPTAAQWYSALPVSTTTAGLPHEGSLKELSNWWESLGDPLLVELVASAQAASPSVTVASLRIAQARHATVGANAASEPNLALVSNTSRGGGQLNAPVASVRSAGFQASWEFDMYGGTKAAQDAAQARLTGSQAGWHEARVSVAAEVANTYLALRICEQLVSVAKEDIASRAETARLTNLLAKAGFTAPANAALASASSAQAQSALTMQRTQCDMQVKALVALTTLIEPEIRQKLASNIALTSIFNALSATNIIAISAIPKLPAQLLAQRPDIFAAQQDLAAASGDVGSAQAAKYPRLGLNGSLGLASLRSGGITTDGATWSIGPVSMTLPILDGGRSSAALELANANYQATAGIYKAKVRAAVREVEEALLNIQSASDRVVDTKTAADGYGTAFAAAEARFKSGLGNLSDLEDTRRTALASKTALLNLERDRSTAWVALYRALGGGWSTDSKVQQESKTP